MQNTRNLVRLMMVLIVIKILLVAIMMLFFETIPIASAIGGWYHAHSVELDTNLFVSTSQWSSGDIISNTKSTCFTTISNNPAVVKWAKYRFFSNTIFRDVVGLPDYNNLMIQIMNHPAGLQVAVEGMGKVVLVSSQTPVHGPRWLSKTTATTNTVAGNSMHQIQRWAELYLIHIYLFYPGTFLFDFALWTLQVTEVNIYTDVLLKCKE